MSTTPEQRVAETNRKLVAAEIVIDPASGEFSLIGRDGTLVAEGQWSEAAEGRRTISVPLSYDGSVYFDALVDRRRCEERAERLRICLLEIERARTVADVRQIARGALGDPFEVAVKAETDERREAEGRRRAAREAAEGEG